MPIFISDDIPVGSGLDSADFDANNPRIGWQTIVRSATVTADSELATKPAINVRNVNTAEAWASAIAGEQGLYVSTGSSLINYFAIAKHNFGTAGIAYKFQTRQSLVNYQDIDVGGDKAGGDIAIDAIDGDFDFTVSVDGNTSQQISITYSSATNVTFTSFMASVNAQLVGATMTIESGDLRITSDTANGTIKASINITDPFGDEAFETYVNGFAGFGAANGWIDQTQERIPSDDKAIMHEFAPVYVPYSRLWMNSNSGNEPTVAIFYIGSVLTVQRRLYVGHTPINFARNTTEIGKTSMSGNFLGKIVKNTMLSSRAAFNKITPGYYRQYMQPFALDAEHNPFFFAWRPQSYPDEVGFCWTTKNIVMENEEANGMVKFDIMYRAIEP